MKGPSAYDNKRIAHINWLMEDLNIFTSEIYECLVDKEYEELSLVINNLILRLTEIKKSTEDEV